MHYDPGRHAAEQIDMAIRWTAVALSLAIGASPTVTGAENPKLGLRIVPTASFVSSPIYVVDFGSVPLGVVTSLSLEVANLSAKVVTLDAFMVGGTARAYWREPIALRTHTTLAPMSSGTLVLEVRPVKDRQEVPQVILMDGNAALAQLALLQLGATPTIENDYSQIISATGSYHNAPEVHYSICAPAAPTGYVLVGSAPTMTDLPKSEHHRACGSWASCNGAATSAGASVCYDFGIQGHDEGPDYKVSAIANVHVTFRLVGTEPRLLRYPEDAAFETSGKPKTD